MDICSLKEAGCSVTIDICSLKEAGCSVTIDICSLKEARCSLTDGHMFPEGGQMFAN
jgi:hypothetical protein